MSEGLVEQCILAKRLRLHFDVGREVCDMAAPVLEVVELMERPTAARLTVSWDWWKRFGDWQTLNQEVRGGRYTRIPIPV